MRAVEATEAVTMNLDGERIRNSLDVRGLVQGVGFRPYVYNLANDLGLGGFVSNTSAGAHIEVEGSDSSVAAFVRRLPEELPALARMDGCTVQELPCRKDGLFVIRESDRTGAMQSLVLPDVATCAECLAEVADPEDRRYRYPFTNCTHCGPRYSIIESMPYDRPFTTMARFPMCDGCRQEYEDPTNRRFHAQPVACPQCGPQLAWWDKDGVVLAERDEALLCAVKALCTGAVVALKGLGGFQLLVDAGNEATVQALRDRKGREAKPFALMYPSLDGVRAHAEVSPAAAALLQSPQAPIVLLRSLPDFVGLAPGIAPDTDTLGIMLPYTPLHHLLLSEFGGPLVVTSGNRGEEPICIDEAEALARLGSVADYFLVHDRPIARQVDDSIVTVVDGSPMMIRRARGYAPAPLPLATGDGSALAVGGHLKNSVAYCRDGVLFPSQHIGNLENTLATDAFQKTIYSMGQLLEVTPERVVHDLHPDYASTRFALDSELPAVGVQHHHAHVLSCMAEHDLDGPVLGVSWDGTGYGTDGTVWGGEFLVCTRRGFERAAHLRSFKLPGGDAASRDTRRSALGLLYEIHGSDWTVLEELPALAALSGQELSALTTMLERDVNAPRCTSMGRLFDAVASLCGLCHRSGFEGQAAMRLEREAGRCTANPVAFEFDLEQRDGRLVLDWQPLVAGVIASVGRGDALPAIAKGFHFALAKGIVQVVQALQFDDVVLTGGCFQNTLLLEEALAQLRAKGYRVYRHGAVPPNDGGIAIGQAWFRPEREVTSCV